MKHITPIAIVLLCISTLGFAQTLPPSEAQAKERLNKSSRHGEMIDIAIPDSQTRLKAFIVYPEKKEKAPVVIVIQEIFGLSDWIRGVADQLAADGFIAIAPDMLSGKGPNGGGTEAFASRDDVMKAVRAIDAASAKTMLDAVRAHGAKLPASTGKTATIGFCWGGQTSFQYATVTPELSAAVVYYGRSPEAGIENIKAPVAGFYGSDDARVNTTIDPAQKKMKELNKPYTVNMYEGAGHGFLRQQDGQNGANKKASEQAWPATIKFLQENTK